VRFTRWSTCVRESAFGVPAQRAVITIAACASLTGCEPDRPALKPSHGGTLILAAGELIAIDVRDGSRRTLKNYPGVSIVDNVTALSRDSVVFQVCEVVDGCSIHLFDLVTGRDSVLVEDAESPTVDVGTRSLVFLAPNGKGRAILVSAPMRNVSARTKIAEVTLKSAFDSTRVVDHRTPSVVVEAGLVYLDTDNTLVRYSTTTGARVRLPVTNCTPVAARTRTDEVLCLDIRSQTFSLVRAVDGTTTRLPAADGSFAAVYDSTNDELYLAYPASVGLIETTNVYRLQLRDMKKELFLKDQYFTGGVWKAPIGNK
jgi:hypothetical protein